MLQFAPQAASETVYKVLASAIANAENNERLDPDSLLVRAAYVDEGPTLKRFRPRAQGRAYRIRKRTCHITIEVESVVVGGRRRPYGRRRPKAAPAEGRAGQGRVRRRRRRKAGAGDRGDEDETPTTTRPTKAPAKKAAAAAESERQRRRPADARRRAKAEEETE